MTTTLPERVIFSVDYFCEAFSISRSSFYREVAAGRLSIIKQSQRTFVALEEAQRWVENYNKSKMKKQLSYSYDNRGENGCDAGDNDGHDDDQRNSLRQL